MKTNKKYYEYFMGNKVSDYGLENGLLDYACLSKCFDCVLANNYGSRLLYENGELVSGDYFEELEEGQEENYQEYKEFFQFYIVSDNALELLQEANETVIYDNENDLYVWCIEHYGTSWSYVLTSIELREVEED